MSFTGSVEPDVLDVDKLNEKLAVKGRLRLRHAMKPDEGYGMVFSFDGVVCDTQQLRKRAWHDVAQRRGAQACQTCKIESCVDGMCAMHASRLHV